MALLIVMMAVMRTPHFVVRQAFIFVNYLYTSDLLDVFDDIFTFLLLFYSSSAL